MRNAAAAIGGTIAVVLLVTAAPAALLAGVLLLAGTGVAVAGLLDRDESGRSRWSPEGVRKSYGTWTGDLEAKGQATPSSTLAGVRGFAGAQWVRLTGRNRSVYSKADRADAEAQADRDDRKAIDVATGRVSPLASAKGLYVRIREIADPAEAETRSDADRARSLIPDVLPPVPLAVPLDDETQQVGYVDYGGEYRWIDPDGNSRPDPEGFSGSPAERRFFDLRRSGYTGAIDQDGYRIENVDDWIAERLARNTDQTPDSATPPTPGTSTTDQEDNTMTAPQGDVGTGGRASIAGLVVDWESSVEARQHPETFIAWLQSQAAAARHRAQMVPDLVEQFHGRGPQGHAGVPESQIGGFAKAYEESAQAEADGYEQWAQAYASYVEEAQEQMTTSYGAEVIKSAHEQHSGSAGGSRAA